MNEKDFNIFLTIKEFHKHPKFSFKNQIHELLYS